MSNPRYPEELKIEAVRQVSARRLAVVADSSSLVLGSFTPSLLTLLVTYRLLCSSDQRLPRMDSMHDLRFSRTFALLQQEGHLARTSLLSEIDLLLKANLDERNIGRFYSAFFQLTVGIERILKLVIITNHMLENNYKPPTDEELRKKYGHNLKATYLHALSVRNKWGGINLASLWQY